jgi:transposase-like protein
MERITITSLSNKVQTDSDAYEFLERLCWPEGKQICPHCGCDAANFIRPLNGISRRTRTGAGTQRRLWQCCACRKQFSVLTGTIMHGTKISVRVWLFVIFEMCANKNGLSAREVERKYGLTPKSAWFMTQRIREAMKREPLVDMLRGTIVADETFIGGAWPNKHTSVRNPAKPEPARVGPGNPRPRGPHDGKVAVLSLIDTGTGEVRSKVIPDVTGATLRKAIAEQVDMAATTLHTDEGAGYRAFASEFAAHETVNHSADEYVRGGVTTNHAEGYFSQLKRSIDGTHHHVSREHLDRYLAEFDFRYSTRKMDDTARLARLMGQTGGRRLSYKPLTQRD